MLLTMFNAHLIFRKHQFKNMAGWPWNIVHTKLPVVVHTAGM